MKEYQQYANKYLTAVRIIGTLSYLTLQRTVRTAIYSKTEEVSRTYHLPRFFTCVI